MLFKDNTPLCSQNQQISHGLSIQNPQWNPKPCRISILFSKTLWTPIFSPKPCWQYHFESTTLAIFCVYLYLYFRRICVFSSSPAAHCTHQPAFSGKARRSALRFSRSLYKWTLTRVWTRWRAKSSRKLLPKQRPQCKLVSNLFCLSKLQCIVNRLRM